MKRLATSFVITAVLALAMPLAAAAQTRYYDRYGRSYYTRSYPTTRYQTRRYYNPNRRSFYQRHRTAVNTGAGAGAGAIIGAMIGGKKGAIIGALAGAGGGYIYTKARYNNGRTYRRY
jgi:outer membrane lipoprotein SlyB